MTVRSVISLSLLILCAVATGCGPTANNNAEAGKSAADKAAADKAAPDKAAADKAAADKAAADKAVADKAATDKAAADRAAADKAEAERAATVRSAKRVQAINNALGDYLYKNELNLTGGIGQTASFTAEGSSQSIYRDSLHSPADADMAVRKFYQVVLRLVEQQGGEVKDPRELPAGKRVYSFDLHYTADDKNGVVSASFLPFEGDWTGEEKKAARLSVGASESPK